jgi:hypothetical protein
VWGGACCICFSSSLDTDDDDNNFNDGVPCRDIKLIMKTSL